MCQKSGWTIFGKKIYQKNVTKVLQTAKSQAYSVRTLSNILFLIFIRGKDISNNHNI